MGRDEGKEGRDSEREREELVMGRAMEGETGARRKVVKVLVIGLEEWRTKERRVCRGMCGSGEKEREKEAETRREMRRDERRGQRRTYVCSILAQQLNPDDEVRLDGLKVQKSSALLLT